LKDKIQQNSIKKHIKYTKTQAQTKLETGIFGRVTQQEIVLGLLVIKI